MIYIAVIVICLALATIVYRFVVNRDRAYWRVRDQKSRYNLPIWELIRKADRGCSLVEIHQGLKRAGCAPIDEGDLQAIVNDMVRDDTLHSGEYRTTAHKEVIVVTKYCVTHTDTPPLPDREMEDRRRAGLNPDGTVRNEH